jgi:hypothetical protein
VAKRPDVLVIESGEIELPGNPEMKNIGLPDKVAYACLAETIVLALEGRFEVFTIGRDIEWEKVKTIYKLGLKHGMKLAAISGVNGVFTDEDIAQSENTRTGSQNYDAIQLAEVAVKRIIQISLGPSLDDNEFETRFLDQSFSRPAFWNRWRRGTGLRLTTAVE